MPAKTVRDASYSIWAGSALVLIVVNAGIYLPVTFLTAPEDMNYLVSYYVMSRPNGFWGPVMHEALRRGLLQEETVYI